MWRFLATTMLVGMLVGSVAARAGDGDCTDDCRVDMADFALLQRCFRGGDIPPPDPKCSCVDFNDDGDVDLEDLAAFDQTFTGPATPIPPNVIELAGDALNSYPHFDYVRAFNMGSPVSIAVDPTRTPALAGAACDLYVVQARTPQGWAADPSLVDVRPAGPEQVAFTGGLIQDNTFEITGSAGLDADNTVDPGHPYDLVLDCDGDGLLGCTDYIDGFSEEAGFYVVHDITQFGPLATTALDYDIKLADGSRRAQKLFYPDDIAQLGPRPLILIGHGGGMCHDWYDHIQEHLASYGYITVSHVNVFTVGNGDQAVNLHTDAFLNHLDTIAGGALVGLVDTDRIAYLGHSFGGQEILIAYDALIDGEFVPNHFSVDGVKLLSSIAANSLLGPDTANPRGAIFHVLLGAGDAEISGAPDCTQCQPLRHYDRARGFRHVTYVHGAGHGAWNCCGFGFLGPPGTQIEREEAHRVMKAVYLSLLKHYFDGNIPTKDYLWRQWEFFRPIGVAAETTVVQQFSEPADGGKRVIEDYQANPALDLSSAGADVTFDVAHLAEELLDDADNTFTWTPDDPMNGMTYAGPGDDSRGAVFDWATDGPRFLEFTIPADDRDFSPFAYFSLRACQGTRHPQTIAEDADLTFTVGLIDGDGDVGAINIGAYGGGIEEPYPRTRAGEGVGWQNEFETVRIRLDDFRTNGTGVDLTDIAAVRLEFGAAFGSPRGRLGLDDIELHLD